MKTRLDILQQIKSDTLEKMVPIEVDLAVLRRTDPDAVIVRKPLKTRDDGEVVSWREVKCSELIEKRSGELEGYQKRLDEVEILIKAEK